MSQNTVILPAFRITYNLPLKQIASVICTLLLLFICTLVSIAAGRGAKMDKVKETDMNYRNLISNADLHCVIPAAEPVKGHPIGNGRMGTMVWTSSRAVNFQINRVDVFAVNKNHKGARDGTTDYGGACAQITVDTGGEPFLASPGYVQHLSLYDAEDVINGEKVTGRVFVSSSSDLMALEIDDMRTTPQQMRVTVSMWRPSEVVTGTHNASYCFGDKTGEVSLIQKFTDTGYYCGSAVAVKVVGAGVVESTSGASRTIVVPAANGKRLILVSSAASWDSAVDLTAAANRILKGSVRRTYTSLRTAHTRWWNDFWSRTYVELSSTDGMANAVERLRNLQLYYMASSSRGVLPPKWNASIFSVDGDKRAWGSQYWVWTTETSYWPLLAADAINLSDPFFDMYVNQLPDARIAAKQRWNARGAYILEAGPYDGPVVLPDDVAVEYRDVYLGRKPNARLSPRALSYGQFECVLTQFADGRAMDAGRYSYVSHIASSGSEIAAYAWWRYRYTGDKKWLASHAYPLLKDTVEFYRSLAVKADDGKYHLSGLNQHEDYFGVHDGIMDQAAIRGTVPLTIHAAEILGADPGLQSLWREFLNDLAPYPMGSDPESKSLSGGVIADDTWSVGHLGDVNGSHNVEDLWLTPIYPFEDWTLETREPMIDAIAQRSMDISPRHSQVLGGAPLNTAIRSGIAAARAGRGDDLPAILSRYYSAFAPLPNGMSLFEGATAHSTEHLGLLSSTVQEGLLQSLSPKPGQPDIISVFPAWPKKWNARFRLLARGGFLVTSSINPDGVGSVNIYSRRGEKCRFRNYWKRECEVEEIGGPIKKMNGDILVFNTRRGKNYRITPLEAK